MRAAKAESAGAVGGALMVRRNGPGGGRVSGCGRGCRGGLEELRAGQFVDQLDRVDALAAEKLLLGPGNPTHGNGQETGRAGKPTGPPWRACK